MEVILDIIEQNIKLSSESIKESEAEVGDFLNYLADERRRVKELGSFQSGRRYALDQSNVCHPVYARMAGHWNQIDD